VCFIDHDEMNAIADRQQDVPLEGRVEEFLRGDHQQAGLAGLHVGSRGLPVVLVGRVHGHRLDSGAPGRFELIGHQRDLAPQQLGGHEVHHALAPAGPLDNQQAGVVVHELPDGFPLPLAKLRGLGALGRPEDLERLLRRIHGGRQPMPQPRHSSGVDCGAEA